MELYCGTSGFSFKQWKGPFYPANLPAERMLEFYAAHLPTVEINNTFYRMPRASVLEAWAAKVPESFRFAVKAPRRISHIKKLGDCGQETAFLFDALKVLGPRLGCVLVQLPPHARVKHDSLREFLDHVPTWAPLAFEFRHASWREAPVLETLREHGAAWVTTHDAGAVPDELTATTTWTYLRLRAPGYSDRDLEDWRRRCAGFERAFVFFKHEDEAAGPALAARMLAASAPATRSRRARPRRSSPC